MASYGAHPLLWRLAGHPAIPMDLSAAMRAPVDVLFQAEAMADGADRIARKQRLEAAADRAHAEGLKLAGVRRGR